MTKRIAIQLFGHTRDYLKSYKSFLRNVVDVQTDNMFDIDIFFHTWGENHHWEKRLLTQDEKDRVVKIYQPKEYVFDEQKNNYQDITLRPNDPISANQLFNQYYTMYRANQIRKDYSARNNVDYDFVLTTRFDIFFKTKLDLQKIVTNPFFDDDKIADKVFIGFGGAAFRNLFYPELCYSNDCVFFAKPDAMDSACDLITTFEENIVKKGFVIHEKTFIDNIKQKGLEPILINYQNPADFCLNKQLKKEEPIFLETRAVNVPFFKRFITCFILSKKLRRKIRGQI